MARKQGDSGQAVVLDAHQIKRFARKPQPVEDPPVLPYQTNMWFQIKTLLTSILLLIALCFGASANFDALNRTDVKIIPVGSGQTGNQIKGGLEIATIAVPGAVIKTLKHLKTEGKLPNSTSNRAGGKDDANRTVKVDIANAKRRTPEYEALTIQSQIQPPN